MLERSKTLICWRRATVMPAQHRGSQCEVGQLSAPGQRLQVQQQHGGCTLASQSYTSVAIKHLVHINEFEREEGSKVGDPGAGMGGSRLFSVSAAPSRDSRFATTLERSKTLICWRRATVMPAQHRGSQCEEGQLSVPSQRLQLQLQQQQQHGGCIPASQS